MGLIMASYQDDVVSRNKTQYNVSIQSHFFEKKNKHKESLPMPFTELEDDIQQSVWIPQVTYCCRRGVMRVDQDNDVLTLRCPPRHLFKYERMRSQRKNMWNDTLAEKKGKTLFDIVTRGSAAGQTLYLERENFPRTAQRPVLRFIAC